MKAKRRGCWITSIVGLFFVAWFIYGTIRVFTPRKFSEEDPKRVFEQFVCKPIPNSVDITKVDGGMAFAGGNVHIVFTVNEEDRAAILDGGDFKPIDEVNDSTIHTGWMEDSDLFANEGGSLRYVRVRKGTTSEAGIFFSKTDNRAYFRLISY